VSGDGDRRTRAYRLAYDGRPFHGFQRQPDVATVEDALLDALVELDLLGPGEGRSRPTPPGYAAAGRTDAGVSALAQTVAFAAPAWLSPAALDGALPRSVRAWADAAVAEEFHATHDATRRRYVYHLHAPPDRTDDTRLRAVADRLAGEHDLHNLTPDERGTVRSLSIDVERAGAFLVVRVAAGGFARQLVRRLVGLLDEAGRGVAGPDRIDRVLGPEPVDGPEGVAPAPAEPLVLVDVAYPDVCFERDADAVARAVAAFGERRRRALARGRALGAVRDGLAED
jgi:tRNA pseudouridine38-40 synthase